MEWGALIDSNQREYYPDGADAGVLKFSDNYFKLLKKFDTLKFYGAGHNSFKVDGIIFEVLENPDDGYRSSFGGVVVRAKDNNEIFFQKPVANVRFRQFEDGDECLRKSDRDDKWADGGAAGFQLVDVEDGHIWVEFGTDMYDGYYPCYYFTYTPKEPKT